MSNNIFTRFILSVISLLLVSLCIASYTINEKTSQLTLNSNPTSSSLQAGLLIDRDCSSINCSDTISPLRNRGNEFLLRCKYISPQIMNVTIQWVYGANSKERDYNLVCWQSSEIGRIQDTIATKKIDSKKPISVLSFDNLNMKKFEYTVALQIRDSSSEDFYNYPVSVHIPMVVEDKNRIDQSWESNNQTRVIPFNFTDDVFRCSYEIPNGNFPKRMSNYIVLFKGGMTPNFNKIKIEDFTSLIRVKQSYGGEHVNIDLHLETTLERQKLYTLAYLMGDKAETVPNPNGLVAWITFIAN
ncbi:MAG: hypothetical protein JKY48_00705 [Flavobacteriales bacterium]|nr:hypothetical protein [Flavobacteriales bacterium]